MKTLHAQVTEFMQTAGQHVGKEPGDTTTAAVKLQLSLISEELDELNLAVDRLAVDGQDSLPEIADAICDLLYVVTGLGVTVGLPLPALMDEVHRTNMLKFGPGSRRDPATGKQLKPVDWKAPDLASIIVAARDMEYTR